MATIYRRGKTWWGRVQRQGREIRQSLATTAEGVARKRLKRWLDELDAVAWGDKPRRTFDDLALKFIDEYLPLLKPRSARRYVTSIAALTDSFEGMHLDEIAGAAIAKFEAKRRNDGWRIPEKLLGKKRPRVVKAPTIRRDLACLSSMFGFAITLEWAEANPVSAYLKRGKKRGLRESPPRRRYLTVDEEARLLAAARDKWAERDLCDAICAAIDTGLRLGELFGLRREQVELDRNRIRLTEGTKNSKPRDVPLLPRVGTILGTRQIHLRSPFVFVNAATGEPYRHMNRGLAGAAKRAGIAPLTWHDLRRTCGCRLLQAHGLSMEQVSRWLGHSSVLVTERTYAFLEEEHLQRAIRPLTKTGTGNADNV